jgi:hypothetical protein
MGLFGEVWAHACAGGRAYSKCSRTHMHRHRFHLLDQLLAGVSRKCLSDAREIGCTHTNVWVTVESVDLRGTFSRLCLA